eukprot:PhM_4_TR3082/c0_g1_i1/m.53986
MAVHNVRDNDAAAAGARAREHEGHGRRARTSELGRHTVVLRRRGAGVRAEDTTIAVPVPVLARCLDRVVGVQLTRGGLVSHGPVGSCQRTTDGANGNHVDRNRVGDREGVLLLRRHRRGDEVRAGSRNVVTDVKGLRELRQLSLVDREGRVQGRLCGVGDKREAQDTRLARGREGDHSGDAAVREGHFLVVHGTLDCHCSTVVAASPRVELNVHGALGGGDANAVGILHLGRDGDLSVDGDNRRGVGSIVGMRKRNRVERGRLLVAVVGACGAVALVRGLVQALNLLGRAQDRELGGGAGATEGEHVRGRRPGVGHARACHVACHGGGELAVVGRRDGLGELVTRHLVVRAGVHTSDNEAGGARRAGVRLDSGLNSVAERKDGLAGRRRHVIDARRIALALEHLVAHVDRHVVRVQNVNLLHDVGLLRAVIRSTARGLLLRGDGARRGRRRKHVHLNSGAGLRRSNVARRCGVVVVAQRGLEERLGGAARSLVCAEARRLEQHNAAGARAHAAHRCRVPLLPVAIPRRCTVAESEHAGRRSGVKENVQRNSRAGCDVNGADLGLVVTRRGLDLELERAAEAPALKRHRVHNVVVDEHRGRASERCRDNTTLLLLGRGRGHGNVACGRDGGSRARRGEVLASVVQAAGRNHNGVGLLGRHKFSLGNVVGVVVLEAERQRCGERRLLGIRALRVQSGAHSRQRRRRRQAGDLGDNEAGDVLLAPHGESAERALAVATDTRPVRTVELLRGETHVERGTRPRVAVNSEAERHGATDHLLDAGGRTTSVADRHRVHGRAGHSRGLGPVHHPVVLVQRGLAISIRSRHRGAHTRVLVDERDLVAVRRRGVVRHGATDALAVTRGANSAGMQLRRQGARQLRRGGGEHNGAEVTQVRAPI